MKKILLIDDDSNFRKVLRHQLSGMGWQVDEAEGIEAVEQHENESYALIIVAANIPVFRFCLTILDRIKCLNSQTPAVVVSAFWTAEDAMRFIEAGASDFLEKPCEAAVLRNTVQRWISTTPSR